MKLSIIIPVLNEAMHIERTLMPLQALRQRNHEIILVDGGSDDDSVERARQQVDTVVFAERGRASQMNAGAARAQGDVVWFLHADTRVPENADEVIAKALQSQRRWGRFDVRLSGSQRAFRIIETMMNLRSCITGIATGDQGIFVRRSAFQQLGGYPSIALMEDVAFSKRLLKQAGRPACIKHTLVTSSRRWEQGGILRTVLLMWQLRLGYFFGMHPDALARRYTRS